MKLFFDTETTGKAFFKLPATSTSQPRIVQLAALLCANDGREMASVNVIIRPDGWTIPKEASDIHGITTETADECGVPIRGALDVLIAMAYRADTTIAHNIDFDALVVASELFRDGNRFQMPQQRFCTMHATTNLCKLPGPYGFKWPKLIEAHQHLFGTGFEDAHDAMADVRACARIYFEITK